MKWRSLVQISNSPSCMGKLNLKRLLELINKSFINLPYYISFPVGKLHNLKRLLELINKSFINLPYYISIRVVNF